MPDGAAKQVTSELPDHNVGVATDALVKTEDPEKFLGSSLPAPGVRVTLRDPGPPWLVVDHRFDKVSVPTWPIRLWKVTDVEAAPPSEQILQWSTRAVGFTVVEEVPSWRVFGEGGEPVSSILTRLETFDSSDVSALARGGAPGSTARWDEELELRRGLPGAYSSVVRQDLCGPAFRLVYRAIERVARRDAPSVFEYDPIDGVDVLVDTDWRTAVQSVSGAVAAYGSPDSFSAEEVEQLRAPWRRLFGEPV